MKLHQILSVTLLLCLASFNIYSQEGCTDSNACNYDPVAVTEDGSCAYVIDCTGICGGTFESDDCNNCFDPAGLTTEEFSFIGDEGTFIQEWVVPNGITEVVLEASGAQGGDSPENGASGGLGARVRASFSVNPGEVIKIAIGEQGKVKQSCCGTNYGGGGGGGTYVWLDGSETPMMVAGGGGGAFQNTDGMPGLTTNIGGQSTSGQQGGINGGGGNSGGSCAGAGGAGWSGNGDDSNCGPNTLNGGTKAFSFAAGLCDPCFEYGDTNHGVDGGFGGGGAAWHGGGGGGGYAGGAGGSNGNGAGGGGGSFQDGTLLEIESGVQEGNGSLLITYSSVPWCVPGCTDPAGDQYDPAATFDDGSCTFDLGCLDQAACNYDPIAITDDGTCAYEFDCAGTCGGDGFINGCGQCESSVQPQDCQGGCTIEAAYNFDPEADYNDGSCLLLDCDGYQGAQVVTFSKNNYADWNLTENQDSISPGCIITRRDQQGLFNYVFEQSYQYGTSPGNTEWKWGDFDSPNNWEDWRDAVYQSGFGGPGNAFDNDHVMTLHVIDAGLYFEVTFDEWTQSGNGGGFTYTRTFLIEESDCALVELVEGCMDSAACNYDPAANFDDGSCIEGGCLDPTACNYDMNAPCDDGSCAFEIDCAGNCGGSFVEDACGNCFDSVTAAGATSMTYSGSIETFTVPEGVTELTIEAFGAQGGGNFGTGGGLGARIQGTFAVEPGEQLKVLVGGKGTDHPSRPAGGGGTFITRMDNTPLVVAGGGGGVMSNTNGNEHGQITENGADGFSTCCFDRYGVGGIDGNGATNFETGPCGGNGGGFYGDGQSNTGCGSIYSFGRSFIGGGAGGQGGCGNQAGGFGGGGGGGCDGAGGGGGYSGGGGSYNNGGFGGGGGSYNAGTDATAESGVQSGDGVVNFYYDLSPGCAFGCTDAAADNYDPSATNDDGSCAYDLGCMDASACNYDDTAANDDGSCQYLDCNGVCGGTAVLNDCEECFDPSGTTTADISYTGSVEQWIVPDGITEITIEAFGAQGGDSPENNAEGGYGARVKATYSVSPGDVLNFVVGEQGKMKESCCGTNYGGGGGGGTYVWFEGELTPILVAGGGGGAFQDTPGVPGQVTNVGAASTSNQQGGINGGGGNSGGSCAGAGGAGWAGNGDDSNCGPNTLNGGTKALSFAAGLCDPCFEYGDTNHGVDGGFGGGGAAWHGGGGGGGYSGGAGGSNGNGAGGGGGSYYTGQLEELEAGARMGDGLVMITYSSVPWCVPGCTDPAGDQYDPAATFDDGSCTYDLGCLDEAACNYDAIAIIDDGSCAYEFDCAGTCGGAAFINPCGECESAELPQNCDGGCTIEEAYNYDPEAEYNDGSCLLLDCDGYQGAQVVTFSKNNYADWNLTENQDSISPGCIITRRDQQGLFNYVFEQSYQYGTSPGNTEWKWGDFDSPNNWEDWRDAVYQSGFGGPGNAFDNDHVMTLHVIDAGLYFEVTFDEWTQSGNGGGFTYTRTFLIEESGCALVELVEGCMDSAACNYDPAANFDDGSCVGGGCLDPTACNYDMNAACDDGSCAFEIDCAGNCGGSFVEDACGNCFDSVTAAGSSSMTYSGSIETFTVPEGVTELTIEAFGAQGGGNFGTGGGLGARIQGTFAVEPGEQLKVLVGGKGTDHPSRPAGGGGTFITRMDNTPLVVAGGGGGVMSNTNGNEHGQITENGADGFSTCCFDRYGVGGIDGNGATNFETGPCGGNGGGFYGDGQSNTGCGSIYSFGRSFIGGGTGGQGGCGNQAGGFGGGGGGGCDGAGGGGGYSGGGGSYNNGGFGGGGGSYNAGTDATAESGVQSGDGVVNFYYDLSPGCAFGCTDAAADNYDPSATNDDGSCAYDLGCMDASACNYDDTAANDDGSCQYLDCNGVCGGTAVLNDCEECFDPSGTTTADISYTGSVEQWIVPDGITEITIEAFGAQGGDSPENNAEGGYGARVKATYSVSPGDVLNFVVGEQGKMKESCCGTNYGGGGGGGTYVWFEGELTPILVAGGGGGAFQDTPGVPGQVTNVGAASTSNQQGGINGGGGNSGGSCAGAGGAGWAGNGDDSNCGPNTLNGGTKAFSFAAGLCDPCFEYGDTNHGVDGGFGGGGAAWHGGGGGGGYSGGAGGSNGNGAGGGGGSYYTGQLEELEAGARMGDGLVMITYSSVPWCVPGCTDPAGDQYDPAATFDDGSCTYDLGCLDEAACNYDAIAIIDDGSCAYEFDCAGTCGGAAFINPCGECESAELPQNCDGGCTIEEAYNYDPEAEYNDGSCLLLDCDGYQGAQVVTFSKNNYADWNLTENQDSISPGCIITRRDQQGLFNYVFEQSYQYGTSPGNTEWKWGDFDSPNNWEDWRDAVYQSGFGGPGNAFDNDHVMTLHVIDAGLYFEVTFDEWTQSGNGGGFTYTRTFLIEESGCALVELVEGCMDSAACNYDPAANFDDGSCIEGGCLDPTACNYDMNAPCDDGSCAYEIDCAGTCGGNFVGDFCGNCYDPASVQFSQTYELTGAVETFTVPEGVEEISIEVLGAQGGGNFGVGGGLGARMSGTFTVFPGEQLEVLVGGKGADHPSRPGGGGASAVSRSNNTPMIVAGGGGGVMSNTNGNEHGQITENGADGFSTCCFDRYGVGGVDGNGATNFGSGPCGGNGGGWFTDGQSHSGCGSIYSFGRSLLSGGEAGEGGCGVQPGGFGGGGGGGCDGAGGGGGYSGGGGSYNNGGFGGGGGSYNTGTNQEAEAGANAGDGIVVISWETIPECISGCTDETACNYDANAQGDDGSCLYLDCAGVCGGNYISDECGNCFDPGVFTPTCIGGCTDEIADNYNPDADYDDGTCVFNTGCTDSNACNYDADATVDDDSCLYLDCNGVCGGTWVEDACGNCFDPATPAPDCVLGCTDSNACNYDNTATNDDGSCLYLDCNGVCGGTWVEDACGNCYDPMTPAPACVFGCTDSNADNYAPAATNDDGSCVIAGCMYQDASNYDPDATYDDGTCIFDQVGDVEGCTDSEAVNYVAVATIDDGSCIYVGCTDSNADNYNAAATIDDGSCLITDCAYEGELSVTFTKENYADWTLEENQDRITGNTWIARADNQGMFNAFDQMGYPGNAIGGPSNTEWKLGFTDEPGVYTSWVDAAQNNPNANCNGDVAWSLHIIDTDLYFDIVWHSFTGGNNGGGFSYTRTFNAELSGCEQVALVYGCTDENACNYSSEANINDGSCENLSCAGCTDPLACNFTLGATIDNGTCGYDCYGCTYENAVNFDPAATIDDGTCENEVVDPSTYCSEGTFWDPFIEQCVEEENTCPEDLNGDGLVNSSDLLQFLGTFGSACQ